MKTEKKQRTLPQRNQLLTSPKKNYLNKTSVNFGISKTQQMTKYQSMTLLHSYNQLSSDVTGRIKKSSSFKQNLFKNAKGNESSLQKSQKSKSFTSKIFGQTNSSKNPPTLIITNSKKLEGGTVKDKSAAQEIINRLRNKNSIKLKIENSSQSQQNGKNGIKNRQINGYQNLNSHKQIQNNTKSILLSQLQSSINQNLSLQNNSLFLLSNRSKIRQQELQREKQQKQKFQKYFSDKKKQLQKMEQQISLRASSVQNIERNMKQKQKQLKQKQKQIISKQKQLQIKFKNQQSQLQKIKQQEIKKYQQKTLNNIKQNVKDNRFGGQVHKEKKIEQPKHINEKELNMPTSQQPRNSNKGPINSKDQAFQTPMKQQKVENSNIKRQLNSQVKAQLYQNNAKHSQTEESSLRQTSHFKQPIPQEVVPQIKQAKIEKNIQKKNKQQNNSYNYVADQIDFNDIQTIDCAQIQTTKPKNNQNKNNKKNQIDPIKQYAQSYQSKTGKNIQSSSFSKSNKIHQNNTQNKKSILSQPPNILKKPDLSSNISTQNKIISKSPKNSVSNSNNPSQKKTHPKTELSPRNQPNQSLKKPETKNTSSNEKNVWKGGKQSNKQNYDELMKIVSRAYQLVYFIGQIPYFCTTNMKKNKNYSFKIATLFLYKYVYDKFRYLETLFSQLLGKKVISQKEYDQRVEQNKQIKQTYLKVKNFTYKKQPFPQKKAQKYLDPESPNLCFKDKTFFVQNLYKEIKEIIQFYYKSTKGKWTDPQVNVCYFRMLIAVFIIEQLQFDKLVIQLQQNQEFADYGLDSIQSMTQDQVREKLSECFEIFLNLQNVQG